MQSQYIRTIWFSRHFLAGNSTWDDQWRSWRCCRWSGGPAPAPSSSPRSSACSTRRAAWRTCNHVSVVNHVFVLGYMCMGSYIFTLNNRLLSTLSLLKLSWLYFRIKKCLRQSLIIVIFKPLSYCSCNNKYRSVRIMARNFNAHKVYLKYKCSTLLYVFYVVRTLFFTFSFFLPFSSFSLSLKLRINWYPWRIKLNYIVNFCFIGHNEPFLLIHTYLTAHLKY